MWLAADDKAWGQLIETLRANPTNEILVAHSDLIKKLCFEYATTGTREYFKQYQELLCIMLDARLKNLDLADPQTIDFLSYDENSLEKHFPMLDEFSETLSSSFKKADTEYDDALKCFWTLIEPIYAKHAAEKGMLNIPAEDFINMLTVPQISAYDNPYGKPKQNWKDRAYVFIIKDFCTALKAYMPHTFNAEAQSKTLIDNFYKRNRLNDLSQLTSFYQENGLGFGRILDVSLFIYSRRNTVRFYNAEWVIDFVPGITAKDMLPTVAMQNLVKLAFKRNRQQRTDRYRIVLCMALLVVQDNNQYQGFNIRKKGTGKDPGFILVSPTGERWFAKNTPEVYMEYFHAKLLVRLGVKMPEASLISDEYGNTFIVTRGISRQYNKDLNLKEKTFVPLSDESLLDTPAAFSCIDGNRCSLSLSLQEKQLQEFVAANMVHKTARVSYAKLLLAGIIMGINDLGGHGGNVGVLHSKTLMPWSNEKGESERQNTKFGIVDFFIELSDLSKAKASIKELLIEKVASMQPVFRRMFEELTEEDFMDAAQEILFPKLRIPQRQTGYFVTFRTNSKNVFGMAVDFVFGEVFKELKAMIPGHVALDHNGEDLLRLTQTVASVPKAAKTIKTNFSVLINDEWIREGFNLKKNLPHMKETLVDTLVGSEGAQLGDTETNLVLSYWNTLAMRLKLERPLATVVINGNASLTAQTTAAAPSTANATTSVAPARTYC